MVLVVVDCSFILAWGHDEKEFQASYDVLDRVVRHGGVVPGIWALEVANGLLSGLRRNRITHQQLKTILANIAELPIEVDRRTHDLAWTRILSLAKRHDLSTYDAAYLELATRHGSVLATLDVALRRAATSEGIMVLPARDQS